MGGGQGEKSHLRQQKRKKWKDYLICNFVQVDKLEQYCQTMEEGDYLILFNSSHKDWASLPGEFSSTPLEELITMRLCPAFLVPQVICLNVKQISSALKYPILLK